MFRRITSPNIWRERSTDWSVMDLYWRYWKFGNNSYRNGVTLRSWLGHALLVHFRYNFLEPAKADLSQGRLDLLAMDFWRSGTCHIAICSCG
jgi:hypothetical protein